jgi:8-oxo-dGTP pyrophosphatase MutT (NUDIX family)
MAFPGGRSEPADLDDVRVTALREAQEEVGVAPELVEVIGELPPVLTPTSFRIHPVVGALQIPRSALALQPDPSEVAEAIWIPFSALSRGEIFRQGVPLSEVLGEARWSAEMTHGLGGRGLESRVTDVFQVDQYCIWGATAAMTKNLLERIQASGSAS